MFYVDCVESDRKGLAALGTTMVDNSATGTGTHTQTEAVLHVATAIIGLKCPLHINAPGLFGHAKAWLLMSQALLKYPHPYPKSKTRAFSFCCFLVAYMHKWIFLWISTRQQLPV